MHQDYGYLEIPKRVLPTLLCEGKELKYNSDFIINRSTGDLILTRAGQIKVRNAMQRKYKLIDPEMPKDEAESIKKNLSVDTKFTPEHYEDIQVRLW